MPDVTLRFYELADAEAVHAAALETVAVAGPWMPWCHDGLTIDDMRQWLAAQIEARQAGTAYEFAIVDGAGAYLGGCGLNGIQDEYRMANLGYWVRSSAMGRGVAPAAVEALASWAFANTTLERLEIVCAVDNERSHRVALKAGAVMEGVARARLYLFGRPHDAGIYSIVRFDHSGD